LVQHQKLLSADAVRLGRPFIQFLLDFIAFIFAD
jgi:hypothetical protein